MRDSYLFLPPNVIAFPYHFACPSADIMVSEPLISFVICCVDGEEDGRMLLGVVNRLFAESALGDEGGGSLLLAFFDKGTAVHNQPPYLIVFHHFGVPQTAYFEVVLNTL